MLIFSELYFELTHPLHQNKSFCAICRKSMLQRDMALFIKRRYVSFSKKQLDSNGVVI